MYPQITFNTSLPSYIPGIPTPGSAQGQGLEQPGIVGTAGALRSLLSQPIPWRGKAKFDTPVTS